MGRPAAWRLCVSFVGAAAEHEVIIAVAAASVEGLTSVGAWLDTGFLVEIPVSFALIGFCVVVAVVVVGG